MRELLIHFLEGLLVDFIFWINLFTISLPYFYFTSCSNDAYRDMIECELNDWIKERIPNGVDPNPNFSTWWKCELHLLRFMKKIKVKPSSNYFGKVHSISDRLNSILRIFVYCITMGCYIWYSINHWDTSS